MVVDGVDFFFTNAPFTDVHPYWLWLSPTVMIVLTIAGFYILGDALTKWYEAKCEESS
jgi:ABC-type dipeptide/oligopeptide/nickel transport system permease subunit